MAIEDPPEAERSNPNLPPDIITEILLRLPVKSLLQFRSVSKSWRSLISDPKFVKTHLTICSKDDEIAHHKLIFISDREGNTAMKACHLSPVLNGFSVTAMELDYPMNPVMHVRILGSINGLICMSIFSHGTFLWNPSTRITKKLPDSGIKEISGTDGRSYIVDGYDASSDYDSSIVVGFGYDASTDDYKVVEILCHMYCGYIDETEVMVYSSRTGFWTRIDEFPPVTWLDRHIVFVNGAIHWTAARGNDSFIVSLDVANETFGKIAPPSDGNISLGVLREGLCVMDDFYGDRTDLWIMKEYGVRDSWTKLTSIPYMSEIISDRRDPSFVPLFLSKRGEVLLDYAPRIVLYDPQSQSFKNPDICNFDECYESTTYVESLVSPRARDWVGRVGPGQI